MELWGGETVTTVLGILDLDYLTRPSIWQNASSGAVPVAVALLGKLRQPHHCGAHWCGWLVSAID